MAEKTTNKRSIGVNSLEKQLIKYHCSYDAYNRLSITYEAVTDAENGEVCLRTRYEYDGTSSRIVNMKEDNSTWDSSWDIT